MFQFRFGRIVTKIPDCLLARVEMSTLPEPNSAQYAQFLYPCLKSCALHRATEIVALFKRISVECMIARPGPAIFMVFVTIRCRVRIK